MEPVYNINWWSLIALFGALTAVASSSHSYVLNALDFNVNDIFNAKLLPLQVFNPEQLQNLIDVGNTTSSRLDQWQVPALGNIVGTTDNGSSSNLSAALTSMVYHRHMINEFLLADYIAQQILQDSGAQWQEDENIHIKKRMGEAQNHTDISNQGNKIAANHKLLEDQGMQKYKSWLERTTTLDDIQRQLRGKSVPRRKIKDQKLNYNRRQTDSIDTEDSTSDELDFEDGDITGYAMTSSPPEYFGLPTAPALMPSSSDVQQSGSILRTINKNGYTSGYEDYGIHPPPQPQPHADSHSSYVSTSRDTKEIGLKDITDIALTTLAFLSFGMFILQVLMCITMGKEDTSSMMMMPMEGTESSEISSDGIEEIRRKRRSIHSLSSDRLIMMNDLVRRVLFSIDAVLQKSKDNGSCHYWSLCENNRYASTQDSGQKYWLPIWSLGMSWFATRVHTENTSANVNEYEPIIQSLKAIIIGISSGKCKLFFENSCKARM